MLLVVTTDPASKNEQPSSSVLALKCPAVCNRRRSIVKVLYWDRSGFCLWQKSLEKEKFRWPPSARAVLELDIRELEWLLEGLDPAAIRPHRELSYSTVL